MASHPESALATWRVPQCPFTIEYSPQMLEEIRLAVVDAFFSLPRGGAEIGGILLGKYQSGRLTIVESVPLECEHAYGPSFTLSPKDHSSMAALLDSAQRNPPGRQPVGWYHSHTRSEIHLSEADLAIQDHYFTEAWQVALVMQPHAFLPAKAGFFFREANGAIRGAATYRELVLEPLGTRPEGEKGTGTSPWLKPARESQPQGPVITVTAEVQPEPAAPEPVRAPAAEPVRRSAPPHEPLKPQEPQEERQDPGPPPPPPFLEVTAQRSSRWLEVLWIAAGLAVGGAVYQSRQLWYPRVEGWFHRATPPAPQPYVGLNTLDNGGQLQIRWDRNSPAVREANEGILMIGDGPLPQAIQLNADHLRSGSFTYGRQGERVEVALTLMRPGAQPVREVTTYLGKLPEHHSAPEEDPALRKERDDLARQVARQAADLEAERARSKKLAKDLVDVRNQLKRAQVLRRLENQSPGAVKQ